MGILYLSTGTKATTGTTSQSIAYPAHPGGTLFAGDIFIAARTAWLSSVTSTLQGAPWIRYMSVAGGTGTATGAHTTILFVDVKTPIAGTESGTLAFTQGNTPNGVAGQMVLYQKGVGATSVGFGSGTDNTHGTGRTVVTDTTLDVQPKDVIVVFVTVDTNTTPAGASLALSMSGVTFSTPVARSLTAGATTGSDGNIVIYESRVLTGTASSAAATITLTTTTSQCGPIGIIRLRDLPPTAPIVDDTVEFYESFTAADQNVITSGVDLTWTHGNTDWGVRNGRCTTMFATPGTIRYARAEHSLSSNNQFVQAHAQLPAINVRQGVAARYDSASHQFYYAQLTHTGAVRLGKLFGATDTHLATSGTTPGLAGGTLRIECNGSTIRGMFDGSEVVTATDTDIPSGARFGLVQFGSSFVIESLDNVIAGTVPAAGPPTIQAAAALTASSTLTTTGFRDRFATATLTGTATLKAWAGPMWVVGTSKNSSAVAVTSTVLDVPAGTVDDDLLVASVSLRSSETMSTPSGWNAWHTGFSGSVSSNTFWRRASSEPASRTLTWSGATRYAAMMVAIRGANVVSPERGASAEATGSTSAQATFPSVTATVATDWMLAIGARRDPAVTTTWSSPTLTVIDSYTQPSGGTGAAVVLAFTSNQVGAYTSQTLTQSSPLADDNISISSILKAALVEQATADLTAVSTLTATGDVTVATIADIPPDFTTAAWTKDSGATATATRLTLDHDAGLVTAVTAATYVPEESRVFWKVAQRSTTGDQYGELSTSPRVGTNGYWWTVNATNIYPAMIWSGGQQIGPFLSWNSSLEYLSIRESAGIIYWERSETGRPGSWQPYWSAAHNDVPDLPDLKLSFWANSGTGDSWIESLNTPLPAGATLNATAALTAASTLTATATHERHVVTDLGRLGFNSATTAAATLAVTNSSGKIIPAGTFLHVTGTWDNTTTVTAPTITCSTLGGTTATANHATPVGSGVTTTAGTGVWHTCFSAVTTTNIAVGATICTLTSNQSVRRAAHVHGWSGVNATPRGALATATSAVGTPSAVTAGTALEVGDLVVASVSVESNTQAAADSDTFNGSWGTAVGTQTASGLADTNVGTQSQGKIVTATGTQTYDPVSATASDTVACVYSVTTVESGGGVKKGTAALTAASTLTATVLAGVTHDASADLTGTATLTATAVREPQSAADLTATSTLTVTGLRTALPAATLTAAGTLTATGDVITPSGLWLNKTSGVAARNASTTHTVDFGFTSTSGNLLVVLMYGAITHTVSGWTERLAPVNSGELSVFTKTSTGDTGITDVHNGSDYPCGWIAFEFPAGSSYTNGSTSNTGDDTPPALGSLPGTAQMIVAAVGRVAGGGESASSAAWAAPWVEVFDNYTARVGTSGFEFTTAYQAGYTGTSITPDAVNITYPGGGWGSADRQRVTFALDVVTAGVTTHQGTVGLTSVSTMTATAVREPQSAATLTATSTLTVTGLRTALPAATLTAAGTLTTTAVRRPEAAVALTATSTLTGTADRTAVAAVALTATSTLAATATGVGVVQATTALVSTSTLTATAVREPQSAASLLAASTLTATAVRAPQATVALAATSTLTATAVREPQAVATLSSTGTLSSTAVRIPVAAAALVTSSTLTATAYEEAVAAAALTGTSLLTATATAFHVPLGAAALLAASTLTASGLRNAVATVTLTGVNTLTSTAVRTAHATTPLTSTGTLTTAGVREPQAAASLASAATLTAAAVRTAPVTATLTAASTLTATATAFAVLPGAVTLVGQSILVATGVRDATLTAALTATGTLATTAVREPQAAAALAGTVTLTATGVCEKVVTAALTGTSTLTATAVRVPLAVAALTAVGTLTTVGLGVGVAAAPLTAVSTLTTAAIRAPQGAAALTGTGTLAATGRQTHTPTVVLTGIATLAATGVRTAHGNTLLSGVSTLTATATQTNQVTANLTGTATLTATGIVTGVGQVAAPLAAAATLTSAAVRTQPATAAFAATSTLTATGVRVLTPTAALTGTSTLTATAVRIPQSAAALNAASTLTALGVRVKVVTADLTVTSVLTATTLRIPQGTAALTATSVLTATAVRAPQSAATLIGASTLISGAGRETHATAALAATSTLTATASIVGVGLVAATLSATATLGASAVRTVLPTVALGSTSTLAATGDRVRTATVTFTAAATLSTAGTQEAVAAVTLTVTSLLTVGVTRFAAAAAALVGISVLTANGTRVTIGTVMTVGNRPVLVNLPDVGWVPLRRVLV
jgi:hypothetical protein